MTNIVQSTASFTRPTDTTAYASGDLIANSTTAGSVVPMQFNIPFGRGLKLWGASVLHSTATTTNAKFRVHLYRDSPTPTNGDNGAWLTTNSNYLGAIDVDTSTYTFSDKGSNYGEVTGTEFVVTDTDQIVYGLLAATAAYAPGNAEIFTITLIGESYV